MIRTVLREEYLESLNMRDVVDVSMSTLRVTVSRFHTFQDQTDLDMVMLSKQETLELLDFLKKNESNIREMPQRKSLLWGFQFFCDKCRQHRKLEVDPNFFKEVAMKLCTNCGELVDEDYDTTDCPRYDYVWKEVQ